jgi:hypothetical protein
VTSQPLPDEHHFTRYVGASKIYPSFDGKRRVDSDRFLPRPDYPPGAGPEEFVSVDWLEHFQGISRRQQLDQVCNALQGRGITVSRYGGFAVVNVFETKTAGLNNGRTLRVRTTGEPDDPSHSGIYGLTPEDDIIAQEIAFKSIVEDTWG